MILPLILAASLATTPVQGFNEPSGVCRVITEYAVKVMTMRQSNMPLTEVVDGLADAFFNQESLTPEAVGLVLKTTALAYKIPVQTNDRMKRDVAIAFSSTIRQSCVEAGF